MHVFDYEVAVVGGSHAGLAAAHTLGRSKRHTVVFDTSRPRNQAAMHSHNFSGSEDISPDQLRAAACRDLQLFPHVSYIQKGIGQVAALQAGYRLMTTDSEVVTARKIVLATGVTDHLQPIEGLAALWGKKIFHCTYCHGWEARDLPALVLVKGTIAWEVAMTISQWNRELTFLLNGTKVEDANKKEHLLQRGWKLIETPVAYIGEREDLVTVRLTDGKTVYGHLAYTKPVSVKFNNELALMLGCEVSRSGSVLTDAGMQTSVTGVFAAGDISHPGYHQVSEAISTGHKAAAFCNNQLCMEDFI